MKKKLLLIVSIVVLVSVIFIVACTEAEDKNEITILQNKVEIDAQLKEFALKFEATSGIKVNVKSCGGDSCTPRTQLKADFNAGEAPDIFVIEGISGYKIWQEYIADLSNEQWVSDTNEAFRVAGTVYGFPIAIEGWGMAYNQNMLDKASIDVNTLTNYNAYKKAFETLDVMKEKLGIKSVVSMAVGPGIEWVAVNHNLNSYLSNGLARDDLSIINTTLAGDVVDTRLREYARWVELLFKYADSTVLTIGDYDAQVGAFATEKAVFIHQGNWIEPNLAAANVTFKRGFAPHGSMTKDTDGIFVSAPSWYVVNKDGNAEGAKEFLQYMAGSADGHDYVVNKILAIPAFKSVKIAPKAPLSASVLKWSTEGKTYAWNQYHLPDAFRGQQLGPIYQQFAKKEISLDKFIDLIKVEIKTLN